jgi:hypothetical protein
MIKLPKLKTKIIEITHHKTLTGLLKLNKTKTIIDDKKNTKNWLNKLYDKTSSLLSLVKIIKIK